MNFYENCAIPKPKDLKKKKKVNGYKHKASRVCYYCDTYGAERHEVYGGNPNRQISIDHGFQVDLCSECHREMEANITEQAKARNKYWQQHYQRLYEDKLIESGVPAEQARDLRRLLIGKSYR